MISIDKKYRTKGGADVRIYAVDGRGIYSVHGAIKLPTGEWASTSWTADGYEVNGAATSMQDLVEVRSRIQHTFAVDICRNANNELLIYDGNICHKLDVVATATVTIDVEEGEGVWS